MSFLKSKISKYKSQPAREIANSKSCGVFKFHGNYGFIEGADLYVRWENMNTALNKDLVEYVVIEQNGYGLDHKNRYEAKILRILHRGKTEYVGEIVHKEKDKTFVLLDNAKLNKVVTTKETKLDVGEKVVVHLTNFDAENLEGQIIKSLGNKDTENIEIKSILADHNIKENFPESVQKEVEAINLNIEEYRKQSVRKDITHLPLVTIDPNDSKDFDDAVFIKKEKNYILYVAIADVWSYLEKSEEINKEAKNRGTSIYFLNSVIPMLPEKLSNNLCSLVPNEERCAMVVSIEIDEKGNILWDTVEIYPAIMISKRRFTYDEVNDFFSGKINLSQESQEIKDSLKHGLQLYKLLEKKRVEKGYLNINIQETKIKVDHAGKVTGIHKYERGDAQIMIENFMILANELVAKSLREKNIPAIYRVHENPDATKLIAFAQEVRKLGFQIDKDQDFNKVTQKNIASWFKNNQKNKNLDLVNLLLLRSLQKAKYSINNLGHFGLNLKDYLHFTSPIRRYPDCMVHKMLWDYWFNQKELTAEKKNSLYKKLDEIAVHSTGAEMTSTEIEREIENHKIIQFLNTKLNSIFKAIVISNTKIGSFVRIENYFVEGFIRNKQNLALGNYVLVRPMHNSKEFKLIKIL